MLSELEQAAAANDKIKELTDKIKAATDMRDFAKKHHDNEGDRIWSRTIKELRGERHALEQSLTYVNFQTFAKVAKAFLTKDQYEAIWRKVDEVIENPSLMQGYKKHSVCE